MLNNVFTKYYLYLINHTRSLYVTQTSFSCEVKVQIKVIKIGQRSRLLLWVNFISTGAFYGIENIIENEVITAYINRTFQHC